MVGAVSLLLTGCIAAATPGTSTDLAAVSRSNPDASASAALDKCTITDSKGEFGANGALGIDIVVGMGLVPHARDAAKYVRLVGIEPEIQTDDPAWFIATKGPIQIPPGPKMWDATCAVIDDVATWFITGDYEDGGDIVTPPPLANPPTLTLPALAP